jgi:hypothetical protein
MVYYVAHRYQTAKIERIVEQQTELKALEGVGAR